MSLQLGFGNRKTNTSSARQATLTSTIHHTFNLNKKNTVYLKNTTKAITSEGYLTNELYRFGGINSIRGFAENSIDASLLSILNTEYRYLVKSTNLFALNNRYWLF